MKKVIRYKEMIEKLDYILKVLIDAWWSLLDCLISDIKQAKEECKDFLSILVKILLWDIPFYLAFGNELDWKGNSYFEIKVVLKRWFWLAVDEVIITPLRPLYFRGEDIYWLYYEMEMSWYVDDDWTKFREHVYKKDRPVIKEFLRDEWETIKEYVPVVFVFIIRQIWLGLRRLFFWFLVFSYRIGGHACIIISALLFRHLFFFVTRFAFIAVLGITFFVFFQYLVFWVHILLLCILVVVYLLVLGFPFLVIYKFLRQKPFFATRTRYRDMSVNPFPVETNKVVTGVIQFLFMLKDRYRARRQMKKDELLLQRQTKEKNERNARVTIGLPLAKSKVSEKYQK